jgi:hypothetical protein
MKFRTNARRRAVRDEARNLRARGAVSRPGAQNKISVEKKGGLTMFPVFPFAAGFVAGAVAVRLLRDEKAKGRLVQAQDRLREAAASGLGTIELSMARLRDKIQAAPAAADSSDSLDSSDFLDSPDPSAIPADDDGASAASAEPAAQPETGTEAPAGDGA